MGYKHISLLLFLMLIISCKTIQGDREKNDLNYMQNIDSTAINAAIAHAKFNTIQVGDQLVISVTALDNKVAAPFNQNYASTAVIQPFAAGGNTPTEGQAAIAGPTYIVDAEGHINFPELGKIETKGKTLINLKEELTQRLTRYIINPIVNIKLANFRVTVIGEVNRQGEYVLANGQGTLLNVLGMAGDLSMYGDRENVMMIRTIDGVVTKEKINLTKADFINSPFYQLKQGDVIFVPSNKTKDIISKQNPNLPLIISAVGTVITLLAILIRR